jgi:dihydrofolate synthase/folylpolyglutamate synthase
LAKANETHSEIYFASDVIKDNFPSALLGDYQIQNKKTVLQTIKVLQDKKLLSISEEAVKNGFLNVIKNTGLHGRWQQLGVNPTIICDTAHNAHGLKIVLQQLKKQNYERLHIVLGVVNDKNLAAILPLFPKEAHYYFCKPNIPRGLDPEILKENAAEFNLIGQTYISVSNAYQAAKENAGVNDFIYIGGSNFVVAEIL